MGKLKTAVREENNKGVAIVFTFHAMDRYKERFGRRPSDIDKLGSYFKSQSLEKEVKRGSAFVDKNRPKETSFYVNYNNMKVYKCKIHTPGGDRSGAEPVLRVETVYPYAKRLRGLLVKCKKANLFDYL